MNIHIEVKNEYQDNDEGKLNRSGTDEYQVFW